MRATGEATGGAPTKSTSTSSSLEARGGKQREIRISRPPVNGYRRPAPILLGQKAYITNCLINHSPAIDEGSNETTATAKAKSGHTMAVSFWVADPPDVSFFSVVSCKPPHLTSRIVDFKGLPHVVGAEGRFVLLRAHFFLGCGVDELFMYTAGAGGTESPSLERIQLPDVADDGSRAASVHGLRKVREYGIVPRGRDYLMAALFNVPDSPLNYQLYIYSSESKTWSSSTLLSPNTGAKAISPEKVITLGEGLLGWVDFSGGLLACDLSQETLSLSFIPLPRPLPSNRGRLRLAGASPSLFRDLICVDGVLKFIEIEHGVKVTEKSSDPWDNDVLYDSDLIRFLDCVDIDDKPKPRDGWRAVTWSRMVSSNCWTKGCVVDVADILVDESADLPLISGQSCESDLKLTFRDLYCAFPILSADNDDIVYLKSTVEPNDRNAWVVAVDLRNKMVKALGGFPFGKDNPSRQAFRTSTLSCHLVMTPGMEVSAYQKFIQTARSANNPNNTSIRMDEPSCMFVSEFLPWESRCKIQRLVDQRMENVKRVQEENIKRAQEESQSSRQNDHAAEACAQNNFLESSRKRQRLCAEKNNLPQNEAQSIAQNGHILQVYPVQNNLSPHQCFNKWNQHLPGHSSCPPFYLPSRQCFNKLDQHLPGHSSCPPLNLPPQRCFNMPGGLNDSGYAPSAPPPVFHGYSDYRPLRHQPPPLNQERPISEFESHKAPQPCLNRLNVASYHGYSQQLPAPDSFAYGTHLGYGNNQQQWQSFPQIYDLPASSPWQQPPPLQHQLTPSGAWI